MIYFVGPSYKRITGQSEAFRLLIENIDLEGRVFHYGTGDQTVRSKVLDTLRLWYCFLYSSIVFVRPKVVYLTTSRSLAGFIRDFVIIFLAKLLGAKVVNHLHGADFKIFYENQNRLLKSIVYFCYSKINCSIVLLPSMTEQYSMFDDMKVISIPNCSANIGPKIFYQTESSLKVLYLSNLMYSKGVLHLLDAVKELSNEGYYVELTVAGTPMSDSYMSEDEIRELVHERVSTMNNVKLVGVVSGSLKSQVLKSSDLFVLPTFYQTEAFPISIIEAFSVGLPVIATNHNYLSSVVNESTGLLIEKESVSSIKDAIVKFYRNRDLVMSIGESNKTLARNKYSLASYVSSVSNVLIEEC